MKPWADGRSASLIIQGLDSSMHALGHNSRPAGRTTSRLAGSTKKGTEAVPRLALAARGAMLLDAEREAGKFATCSGARSEQVWLVWLGSTPSMGLHSNRQSAGPTSLASRLVRTRSGRPESRGALLRGAASSARSPRLPFMCHVRGDQQEAPAVSLLWWSPLEGEEDPLR